MKIGIITSIYEPYTRGGAEVFVLNLVGELKKNHDLFVITTDEWHGVHSLFPRSEERVGVRVYRYYPLNIFSFIHINEKPFFLRALWSVLDLVNLHSMLVVWYVLLREKPTVIMVHTLKGLGYIIATLLNSMSARWIFTPHDVQLVVPSGRLSVNKEQILSSPFIFAYSMVTRFLFGSPPLIVSSSRFLASFYREREFFSHSTVSVLPSPIPEVPSFPNVERSKGRFIFLGQLESSKAIDILIKGFRTVQRSDISLDIIGSGSLVDWVKEQSEEDSRIRYLGYISSHEKYAHLALCGYMIVSSRIIENSPNVIYEAFSMGIPVICTSVGGAAELVEDGVNGYVIPPEDPEALSYAIMKATNNTRYDRMSQEARKTIAGRTLEEYCNALLTQISSFRPLR